MANDVLNRMTVTGPDEVVARLFDFIKGENEKGEDLLIDFNKIIPMPAELMVEESTRSQEAEAYVFVHEHHLPDPRVVGYYKYPYADQAMKDPEEFKKYLSLGHQLVSNREKYGHPTWYDWRRNKWGSKWNADDCIKIDENTIQFITPWNGVPKVIQALADKFPEVIITYQYADDVYNCGSFFHAKGTTNDNSPEPWSVEAFDLCFDLGIACRSDFELVGDEYKYIGA